MQLHGLDETRWGDRTHPSLAELDAVTARPWGSRAWTGICSSPTRRPSRRPTRPASPGSRPTRGRATGRVREGRGARGDGSRRRCPNTRSRSCSSRPRPAARTASRRPRDVHAGRTRDARPRDPPRPSVRLPLDVVNYVATTDISRHGPRPAEDRRRPPVDGSIGARTAFVWRLRRRRRAAGDFGDDELAQFFHDGHLAGLQVGVHAIGDAAIEQVVRTWERVYQALDSRQRRHFRARRHRIEHFEMASATRSSAPRCSVSRSGCSRRSTRWGSPGGLYERALGEERAVSMNPFRTC